MKRTGSFEPAVLTLLDTTDDKDLGKEEITYLRKLVRTIVPRDALRNGILPVLLKKQTRVMVIDDRAGPSHTAATMIADKICAVFEHRPPKDTTIALFGDTRLPLKWLEAHVIVYTCSVNAPKRLVFSDNAATLVVLNDYRYATAESLRGFDADFVIFLVDSDSSDVKSARAD